MKNVKHYFILLAISIFFSSCVTLTVNYSGKHMEPVEKVAFISTMLGEMIQPTFPLIGAAAFNTKTNVISAEIMEMQKRNIDNHRDILVNLFETHFSCTSLYGDSLHQTDEYSEIKTKFNFPNSLQIPNKRFPYIITASNDINPFEFENGRVNLYFFTPSLYKASMAEICKELNVNYLVVSYTVLDVARTAAFGIYGSLRLNSQVFVFDRDGDIVLDGINWSDNIHLSGRNINDYEKVINDYKMSVEPIVREFALKAKGAAFVK